MDDLDIEVDGSQLVIRGKQQEEEGKTYIHRGIAARQFQRSYVLADGIEVKGAHLDNGLLHIDLVRIEPEPQTRKISIQAPPEAESARVFEKTAQDSAEKNTKK